MLLFIVMSISQDALAVPSFARQTGMACTQCHVQAFGPNLTPLGREFKLNGYTQGGVRKFPPISAMIQGSFTNTQKDQPEDAAPNFGKNNNFALDEASFFYAGQVLSKLGAFVQVTYEGVEKKVSLDNTDIRLANNIQLGNQNIIYGISLNNSPTVQDLWNTTPIWGFPFVSSSLAPTPDAAALIDDTLSAQVGGATAYTMINDLLYLEAGAYTTFAKDFQQAMGTFNSEQNKIDGGAPYWRIALQHEWNGHYFELGHYGLKANVFPGRNQNAGTNQFTDLAVDATYQFIGNLKHIFEIKSTYIREDQDLKAS
jgi:hypothetical protein